MRYVKNTGNKSTNKSHSIPRDEKISLKMDENPSSVTIPRAPCWGQDDWIPSYDGYDAADTRVITCLTVTTLLTLAPVVWQLSICKSLIVCSAPIVDRDYRLLAVRRPGIKPCLKFTGSISSSESTVNSNGVATVVFLELINWVFCFDGWFYQFIRTTAFIMFLRHVAGIYFSDRIVCLKGGDQGCEGIRLV